MRYDFGDFMERSSIEEKYLEHEDIHGVDIETESIEQECPLDPVIGGAQQHLFYQWEDCPEQLVRSI